MKKLFKRVCCFLLFYTGLLRLCEMLMSRGTARILLYHKIGDDTGSYFPPVTVGHFSAHMAYLAKRYEIMPLARIVESIRSKRELRGRPAAITFDDGYADVLTCAMPVLRRHAAPATVFIAGDCIRGLNMWTDTLHYCFQTTASDAARIDEFSASPLSLRTDADRKRSCLAVKEWLKGLDEAEKQRLLAKIRVQLNVSGNPSALMLTAAQIAELSAQGVEIGSHSMTHPTLTKTDQAQLREETVSSKRVLEDLLGRRIEGFSYPAGKVNGAVRDAVIGAGYAYACRVEGGPACAHSDLYALERIYVTDVPVYEFAVEVCGIMHFFRNMVRGSI